MSLSFDDLPCAPASRAALRALVASPPASALLVVTGPPGDLPLAAATTLAANLLAPAARDSDLRVLSPAKDRWSIAEVSEQIIAPSRLVPVQRNLLVVDAAEAMDVAAAEHLLKTVEEPFGASLFVFVTSDPEALLPTLRSRAGAVIAVEGLDERQRARQLIDAGAPPELAVELVELCGPFSALAAAAVADSEVLAGLRTGFGAPLATDTPTTTALEVAAALDVLAAAGTLTEATAGEPPGPAVQRAATKKRAGSTKKTDPARRARVRVLVRQLLELRRRRLSQLLAGPLDAAAFTWLCAQAAAVDAAEAELRGYANPTHVVAALLSRADAPPASLPGVR